MRIGESWIEGNDPFWGKLGNWLQQTGRIYLLGCRSGADSAYLTAIAQTVNIAGNKSVTVYGSPFYIGTTLFRNKNGYLQDVSLAQYEKIEDAAAGKRMPGWTWAVSK